MERMFTMLYLKIIQVKDIVALSIKDSSMEAYPEKAWLAADDPVCTRGKEGTLL